MPVQTSRAASVLLYLTCWKWGQFVTVVDFTRLARKGVGLRTRCTGPALKQYHVFVCHGKPAHTHLPPKPLEPTVRLTHPMPGRTLPLLVSSSGHLSARKHDTNIQPSGDTCTAARPQPGVPELQARPARVVGRHCALGERDRHGTTAF